MTILLLCHYTLPHVGGIEVVIDDVGQRLVNRGHRVTVIASRAGNTEVFETRNGVRFIRILALNILEKRFGIPYPLFSPNLLTTLYREVSRADIVHAHGMLYQSSFLGLLFARLMRRPAVLTEHVGFVDVGNRAMNFLERVGISTIGRISSRLANRITVLNSSVRNFMHGLSKNRTVVHFIPNGVDTDLFVPAAPDAKVKLRRELGWDPDRKKVLYVGRFVPKKGVDVLLQCRDSSYDIVLCGPGDVNRYMKDNLAGVEVLPPRPRHQLVSVYQAADLFVVPSRGEGFPLVVQEAMACGLPVIMGNDPAYHEYVDQRYVEIIEPSAENLRRSIQKILFDLGEHERRRRYSRITACQKFSLDRAVDQYLALYADIQASQSISPVGKLA